MARAHARPRSASETTSWGFCLTSCARPFTPCSGACTCYGGATLDVAAQRVAIEMIGRARIHVEDTGKGLAPEFLPKLFGNFRQDDRSTTRPHGGVLEASSAGVGQGATFSITLPIEAPP